MDLNERRSLLASRDNPNKALDYIVTLEALSPDKTTRMSLRYIPDRLILQSDSFAPYIQALFNNGAQSIEDHAATLVEDINNELVTRWVQVVAFEDKGQDSQHSVVLEDRQPQWNNPHLLSRLAAI